MAYGFGRGPGGKRGAGLGFSGSSPSWPYVGRGRGGLPRCQYSGVASSPRYTTASPYAIREQELDLLKGQAEAIKAELNRVEARICDLEANKKE